MKDKELREEFEPIVEITKRIAQIAGILNGSAVHDTGQTVVAQQKLGEILGFLDQALKAKEEEVFDLLKNRQDRFLKKREKLMGKDNYEAGVVIGRLAELEAIKLLLSSLKGKK